MATNICLWEQRHGELTFPLSGSGLLYFQVKKKEKKDSSRYVYKKTSEEINKKIGLKGRKTREGLERINEGRKSREEFRHKYGRGKTRRKKRKRFP